MPVEKMFCGKPLGKDHPPLIVAEVGFNHNGDVALAREMIRAAAEHGADAVKLQTFQGDRLYSKRFLAPDPADPGREIPLYEFFQRVELTRADYQELFALARELHLPLFSTPFDEESLDLLVELGVPAVKVASPDLTHRPFLSQVARTGLPVVLSTGMGTESEIARALETLRKAGNDDLLLLHCVSNYPARYEEMNLACLPVLESRFQVPVGLSDHTPDTLAAVVAASLGAVMIEKHFTLDRTLPGPDQAMSLEPQDLKALKESTGKVRTLLGRGVKTVQPSERAVQLGARRSLVARVDLEPGTILTEDRIAIKRPGTGIPPEDLDRVVGRRVTSRISAEELLDWEKL